MTTVASPAFPFSIPLNFWPLYYDISSITITAATSTDYNYTLNNLLYLTLASMVWVGVVALIGSPIIAIFAVTFAGLAFWRYFLLAPQTIIEWFFETVARPWLFFYPWAILIQLQGKSASSWANIFQ